MASNTTAPTIPITTPCVKAFHWGSRHIHIPMANKIPPMVLIIIDTKFFFFIVLILYYFLFGLLLFDNNSYCSNDDNDNGSNDNLTRHSVILRTSELVWLSLITLYYKRFMCILLELCLRIINQTARIIHGGLSKKIRRKTGGIK